MKFSKVSIVGKGDGWQDAPEEGEVWGVNGVILRKDMSRCFNLHKEKRIKSLASWKRVLEHVNRRNIPFFTIENIEEINNCKVYPIEEISSFFNTRYFANGICYMIAYALWKGVEELSLFGINHKQEWEHRSCVEYWLGRALGMGIKVNIHSSSKLLKTKDRLMYGYLEA